MSRTLLVDCHHLADRVLTPDLSQAESLGEFTRALLDLYDTHQPELLACVWASTPTTPTRRLLARCTRGITTNTFLLDDYSALDGLFTLAFSLDQAYTLAKYHVPRPVESPDSLALPEFPYADSSRAPVTILYTRTTHPLVDVLTGVSILSSPALSPDKPRIAPGLRLKNSFRFPAIESLLRAYGLTGLAMRLVRYPGVATLHTTTLFEN